MQKNKTRSPRLCGEIHGKWMTRFTVRPETLIMKEADSITDKDFLKRPVLV